MPALPSQPALLVLFSASFQRTSHDHLQGNRSLEVAAGVPVVVQLWHRPQSGDSSTGHMLPPIPDASLCSLVYSTEQLPTTLRPRKLLMDATSTTVDHVPAVTVGDVLTFGPLLFQGSGLLSVALRLPASESRITRAYPLQINQVSLRSATPPRSCPKPLWCCRHPTALRAGVICDCERGVNNGSGASVRRGLPGASQQRVPRGATIAAAVPERGGSSGSKQRHCWNGSQ